MSRFLGARNERTRLLAPGSVVVDVVDVSNDDDGFILVESIGDFDSLSTAETFKFSLDIISVIELMLGFGDSLMAVPDVGSELLITDAETRCFRNDDILLMEAPEVLNDDVSIMDVAGNDPSGT